MSLETLCAACMRGDHAGHVEAHGTRPGLIGGEYCGCPSSFSCQRRFAATVDAFSALHVVAGTPPEDEADE